MKVGAESLVAQTAFKHRVDAQHSQKVGDKASDRRDLDESRAVNKSNSEKRDAKIAAERGGVDIKA